LHYVLLFEAIVTRIHKIPKNNNEDRVKSLRDAFVRNGINVKKDVFDDYLAIKYIRNAIVHASWKSFSGKYKEEQLDWIGKRGFPTDTRKLSEDHWQKIDWVNQNMMLYIALTGIPGTQPRSPAQHGNIEVPLPPLPDTTGVIMPSQWAGMYWQNIDRISGIIYDQLQATIHSSHYHWSQGMTPEEIETCTQREQKQRRYLAAQKAVQSKYETFASLRDSAANALQCWTEYMRLVPEFQDLKPDKVCAILRVLRSLHEYKIFSLGVGPGLYLTTS